MTVYRPIPGSPRLRRDHPLARLLLSADDSVVVHLAHMREMLRGRPIDTAGSFPPVPTPYGWGIGFNGAQACRVAFDSTVDAPTSFGVVTGPLSDGYVFCSRTNGNRFHAPSLAWSYRDGRTTTAKLDAQGWQAICGRYVPGEGNTLWSSLGEVAVSGIGGEVEGDDLLTIGGRNLNPSLVGTLVLVWMSRGAVSEPLVQEWLGDPFAFLRPRTRLYTYASPPPARRVRTIWS